MTEKRPSPIPAGVTTPRWVAGNKYGWSPPQPQRAETLNEVDAMRAARETKGKK